MHIRNADAVFVAEIIDRYRSQTGRKYWDVRTVKTIHGHHAEAWTVEYDGPAAGMVIQGAPRMPKNTTAPTHLIFAVEIREQWVFRNFGYVFGAKALKGACGDDTIWQESVASDRVLATIFPESSK